MCLQCDGYSPDDVLQFFDMAVRVYGWALVQVEDDDETWCYTLGLLENYGHPELSLFDVETDVQHPLVTRLVTSIQQTGSLSALDLAALGVRTVEIHPDHLDSDLFGTWAARYGAELQPGQMLQVVPPRSWFCEGHALSLRRFDLPLPPTT